MNDYAQLRVYVSSKYFPLFHEMTKSGIFSQNSEFFMLCLFVGEKNDLKMPLEKKHELCRAATLTAYDNAAMKALYLKEYGELSELKEMVQLAEQYANGGIGHLIATKLKDFVTKDEEGFWHLKPGMSDEQLQLQMQLFDFVLDESKEVPF